MNMICRCGPNHVHGVSRLRVSDAASRRARRGPASDPTGTLPLQKRFMRDLDSRWASLKRLIPDAVARSNNPVNMIAHASLTGQDPVKAFQAFIDEAMRQLVLGSSGYWMLAYVRGAGDIALHRAAALTAARTTDGSPDEPRDEKGQWTSKGSDWKNVPVEMVPLDKLRTNPNEKWEPGTVGNESNDQWTKSLAKRMDQGHKFTAINVHREPDGTLTIIDGRHRYEAAKLLGRTHIGAQIKDRPIHDAGPDDEPRDDHGRWTGTAGQGTHSVQVGPTQIVFHRKANHLTLSSIDETELGKGHASRALDEFLKMADRSGSTVSLQAIPENALPPELVEEGDEEDFVGLKQKELEKWYGSRGFKSRGPHPDGGVKMFRTARTMKDAAPPFTTSDRVPFLQSLCIAELQGIEEAVSQQAVRAFANGLLLKQPPSVIARAIQKVIDSVGVRRGHLLVSWIVVRAFSAVTIDSFRASGISHVGTVAERAGPRQQPPSPRGLARDAGLEGLVEVLTAGDDDVCPECQDISDEGPYDLDTAETLIPAHPRCRCAFVPADDARFASVRDQEQTVHDAGPDDEPRDDHGRWTNSFSTNGPEAEQQVSALHGRALSSPLTDAFNPDQPRDKDGQWASGGDLPSVKTVDKSAIAKIAQDEYDAWQQDAEGVDEELDSGGICDRIAKGIEDHLSHVETASAGLDGDDHAWVLANFKEGVHEIDIPPSVYESGAGYNWTKKLGVKITAEHVVVHKIDGPMSNEEFARKYRDEEIHDAFNPDQPRDNHGMWTVGNHPAGASKQDVRGNTAERASIRVQLRTKTDPAKIREAKLKVIASFWRQHAALTRAGKLDKAADIAGKIREYALKYGIPNPLENPGGAPPPAPSLSTLDQKKEKIKEDLPKLVNGSGRPGSGSTYRASQMLVDHLASRDVTAEGFVRGMLPVQTREKPLLEVSDRGRLTLSAHLASGGSITRVIDLGSGTVDHSFFRVGPGQTGAGIGKDVLRSQVALYQKLGMKKVSVGANINVGGYAWARYGFVPDAHEWTGTMRRSLDRAVNNLDAHGATAEEKSGLQKIVASRDPKAMWAVADSKWGKKLLLGTSWNGTLDLRDAATMRRFNAYVNREHRAT